MTEKPRYAYDSEEGFIVDMHNPQPGGLGTELLSDEVVDKLNALQKEANFLEALRIAGVDNWEGYSHAFELAEEYGLEIE